MKTLVIGDTHGCFDELKIMLKQTGLILPEDRLVMLGDYIDRGPGSYDLLQYLRLLQDTYGKEKVVLLRGNHEQMAIDYIESGDINWFFNAGKSTLGSFIENRADIQDISRYFKSLPLYFADDDFIYVHAGLRPGIKLKQQQAEDMLWIREEFYKSSFDFGKTVIFGHTPTQFINGQDYPIISGNKIAIDTACVHGHYLSAAEIKAGSITRIYQVPAGKQRMPKTA